MSRNDQVIRQWFLLQAIEKRGGVTIEELTRSLPPDYACHPRTVRRDLEALGAIFPLYTDTVDGHTLWKLIDGFSGVPALQFSTTELMALTFTRDLAQPLEGTPIKESLDSALIKAKNALPAQAEEYLQGMQGYFSAGLGAHKDYRKHRELIEQLARAIAKKRTVEMRYYAATRDRTSPRKVDPYHIRFAGGALYLIGYCHLRSDVRMFAVDRILALTVTNLPCQIPLGFNVEDYVRNALSVMRGGELTEVELRFDRKTSAWAKDRIWHPSQKTTINKDGCLTLKLQVANNPELVGWILSFGAGVRVVKPEELHRQVKLTASQITNEE